MQILFKLDFGATIFGLKATLDDVQLFVKYVIINTINAIVQTNQ